MGGSFVHGALDNVYRGIADIDGIGFRMQWIEKDDQQTKKSVHSLHPLKMIIYCPF